MSSVLPRISSFWTDALVVLATVCAVVAFAVVVLQTSNDGTVGSHFGAKVVRTGALGKTGYQAPARP
jgi:preprotein translocase subunit SecG